MPKTVYCAPLAVAATLALLSGCASPGTKTQPSPSAVTSNAPVSIDNCGFTFTTGAAPQHIIAIKSSSAELLLSLGLADRMAGVAFLDGPYPDNLAEAGAAVPVISDQLPSREATLGYSPDYVFSGWESSFADDGVGTRESLADLGIGSYVDPSACKEPDYMPNPFTWDDYFANIEQAGVVFGAKPAADELVTTLHGQLEAITPDTRGLSALWFSSGTDTPYVGAGIGAPQLVMQTVGLTNVMADVDDTWTSASWEAIVERDPDVIVLVDASWSTVQKKIDMLESNPATAALDAVKNKRYIVVDFPGTEGGSVRLVDTAQTVATALADIQLP